ncbi:MAG: bifunctional 3-deoxy-7-phosphoheptulonate synthase/chorismate mutase type II [Bacteroidales bacterium]|nr:bifunctional 3-deoxy-7-phosphoheptulonate synthase/chorismate mutase type II [Bacteroidales bacterium]
MTKSLEIKNFSTWFNEPAKIPFVISGPCSAESFEQLLETAKEIAANGKVCALRAGIWKPRTRPGSFEGVGVKGLKWLSEAGKITGLKTITEVATPKHVEQAIAQKIDCLWIGARTSSNPFSVQEIAEALTAIDIPVFVKNPVNPDINLWIGALERINKAGIIRLGAIHRGFYPFEKTVFRNIPKWELPIELKLLFPNLPVICDPSHIAGNRQFLREISQKALDLNMDGLMIECHINPDEALSDANQQISPNELKKLLEDLVYRKADSENRQFLEILDQLRNQIDSLDSQLLELLGRRMDIVEKIGEFKRKNDITILQLRRWENILKTRTEWGQKLGLDNELIKQMLEIIHKSSIKKQEFVMRRRNGEKHDDC